MYLLEGLRFLGTKLNFICHGHFQRYELRPEKFASIRTETSIKLVPWHHIRVQKFSLLTLKTEKWIEPDGYNKGRKHCSTGLHIL